ncbi:SURF1 family protein [Fulvimarina manganoxydans]|uniref:SURF1 family protein n=1 Tax=Fulvimarina manganoxydans TaxID=937218 RepID=UPI0030811065
MKAESDPIGEDAENEDGANGPVASEPMSRGRFLLALSLCIVGITILMGLGTWQVERLYWKETLIERIETRIHGAPISLDEAIALRAETGDIDYQPVTLTGRFLNDGERYFLSTYEGQAGWNVFTPLVTPEDRMVFVNRGFVPYELRNPAKRPQSLVEDEVSIKGLAREAPEEKPGYFLPDNDPAKDTFFWRDLPAMAEGIALGSDIRLVPFFVDADDTPNPGGLPVGGQTVVTIPNNHLQYAITWYGIGAVLIVMTGMLVANRWRSRHHGSSRDA